MNCGKQEQYERIEKLDMQLHKYQFRYIRHLIDEADLYKGDPRLIMTVVKKEGCTQAELAKVLCIKAATLTVMIKRMEIAGLIERKADEKDLRVIRVYSTTKGKEIAKKTKKIFHDAIGMMFDGIDERELAVYENVLRKISERLESCLLQEKKQERQDLSPTDMKI